jgi:hypothetical protein
MKKTPEAFSQIVGRQDFISAAWRTLVYKSLYMNDLRRIGKTKIIQKMHAEPPPGWLAAFSDLEGTHTTEEFAALVYKDSAEVLTAKQQKLRKMSALLGKAGGTAILGILKLPDGQPAPWKDVLRATFDDIVEALGTMDHGTRMVFFWDEVPYLIENIAKRQGKDMAMQVLDILRELSQRHDTVRLVLTGSIGIHHVLRSLWGDGYKGSPLNHMDLIQPGPLQPEHSVPFAESGIARRGLLCALSDQCAAALAELASHVPFYIEKLAARLPRGESLVPATIEVELDRELRSDNSDWDLDYYRRRVKSVFPETEKLVLAILDGIAASKVPALTFQEIRKPVSVAMAVDDEVLREHLKLLCMDHYLVRDEANAYRFYLPLIRRWWRINRSL